MPVNIGRQKDAAAYLRETCLSWQTYVLLSSRNYTLRLRCCKYMLALSLGIQIQYPLKSRSNQIINITLTKSKSIATYD